MKIGVAPQSELSAWTDARLVGQIAARGASARAEQTEFYRRHVGYLYAVLKRQCAGALARSQQEVEDLVQDTFRRAFERAETFHSDGVTGAEHERQRSRAWLGRIAKHLLSDALSRQRELSTLAEWVEAVAESPEAAQPSPLLRLVEEAIQALPEREQDVLRVFGLYYRAGEVNQRLPNAVSAELAARWNTTPDHIRVIRSRALTKVRAHVQGRRDALAEASS